MAKWSWSYLTRFLIYGANLARPFAKNVKFQTKALDIGNVNGFNAGIGGAVGAVYFTGLDVLGTFIPKIKERSFYRFSKGVGAVGYLANAGANAYRFIQERDNSAGVEALASFLMGAQLLKDSFKLYSHVEPTQEGQAPPEEKTFFKDLGTVVGDAVRTPGRLVKGLKEGVRNSGLPNRRRTN